MKISLLMLLGLFVFTDASKPLRAEEDEKRTWRLTLDTEGATLDYGTNNAEDTPISFSCKPGRGVVDLWINETAKGVKPNRSMTASLNAGKTKTAAQGKTMPNEEAGTPSFAGTMPANDPIFAALSKEQNLVFAVGPSRDQVPLQEIGDKAEQFSRSCEKP